MNTPHKMATNIAQAVEHGIAGRILRKRFKLSARQFRKALRAGRLILNVNALLPIGNHE